MLLTPLPRGTVTFLMTDVEGSTADVGGAPRHRRRGHRAARRADRRGGGAGGGVLIKSKGEGDSTFSVFEDARDAVAAAIELQRALQREPGPRRRRSGCAPPLYTGEAEVRDGDYHGVAPNRGGRLRSTAHGGQMICSQATEELVAGRCPAAHLPPRPRPAPTARPRPGRAVFQVGHPDLPHEFPPLRSLGVRHNLPIAAHDASSDRVDESLPSRSTSRPAVS